MLRAKPLPPPKSGGGGQHSASASPTPWVDAAFDQMDTNRDGVIDRQEFIRGQNLLRPAPSGSRTPNWLSPGQRPAARSAAAEPRQPASNGVRSGRSNPQRSRPAAVSDSRPAHRTPPPSESPQRGPEQFGTRSLPTPEQKQTSPGEVNWETFSWRSAQAYMEQLQESAAQKISSNRLELEDCVQRLAETTLENESLRKKAAQLQGEMEQLEAAGLASELAKSEVEHQNARLKSQVEELHGQYARLNQKFRAQVKEQISPVRDQEHDKELAQANSRHRAERERLEQQIVQLSESLARSGNSGPPADRPAGELDQVRARLADAQDDLKRTRDELDRVRPLLDSAHAELLHQRDGEKRLEHELERGRDQLAAARAQLQERPAVDSEHQQALGELEEQLDAAKRVEAKLRETLNRQQQTLDEHNEELAYARTQLAGTRQQLREQQGVVDNQQIAGELQAELEGAKTKETELKAKINEAQQQLKYANTLMQVSARKFKEQTDAAAETHSNEVHQLREQLAECKSRLAAAEEELKVLGKDPDSDSGLGTVISKLMADREILKKELAAVKLEKEECQGRLANGDNSEAGTAEKVALEATVANCLEGVVAPALSQLSRKVQRFVQSGMPAADQNGKYEALITKQSEELEFQKAKLKNKSSELATVKQVMESRILKQSDELQDMRAMLKEARERLAQSERGRDEEIVKAQRDMSKRMKEVLRQEGEKHKQQLNQLQRELNELRGGQDAVGEERAALAKVTEDLRRAHMENQRAHAKGL